MTVDALYDAPKWLIQVVFLLLMLAAIELGYRLGRKAGPAISEKARGQISVIEGSLVGILGLLLGFTISMAVSRFEARRYLVRDEANAIATSYLRTQVLPEPTRAAVRDLLRRYVQARLIWGLADDDPEKIRSLHAGSLHLQSQFWQLTAEYSRSNPTPANSLLLQSLNQAIDLEASRWDAYQSHIPSHIIYLNVIIALFAVMLVGYAFGLDGVRQFLPMCLLDLAIVVALGMIVDLDRPRHGFITVSQQPMAELLDSIQESWVSPSSIQLPGRRLAAPGDPLQPDPR